MVHEIVQCLKSSWRSLVLTDLLFKILAFVLLTPLVGLLFRTFLAISGRTVLADVDIAMFLLHPLGWITSIVIGGAFLGILALEQSALMAISVAWANGMRLSVLRALRFVALKSAGVFRITARMVVRVLVLAAPFLGAGGGLYVLLLTDHDINYYLTAQPPKFWIAVGVIGVLLAVLAVLVLRCVVNWSIAIQLYLFENISPRVCLKTSKERVFGHRTTISRWIVTWGAANTLISVVATGLVIGFGQFLVPRVESSIWLLALAIGLVLILWGAAYLVTSVLAVTSLAIIQGHIYDRFGTSGEFVPPGDAAGRSSGLFAWTGGRIVSGLVLAVVVAAFVGAMTIHAIRFEDDVQITAHRAGAGNAPENTMSAVRRAIEDKADWVEIDVQESKDGIVIVAHDSDLKKVAGANVKIWEATADELRAIDIGSYYGPDFKDEAVPTLAELLDACHGKVGVNIELKYYGHTQNLEQKVIDLVEERGMASEIVIMSLDAEGVRKVKELRPDWTVGLLTAFAASDLTRADADFLAVSTKLASRSFIRSAHRRQKDVYVWTVNDAPTMSLMISRGANNLITDYPDLARKVLGERALMSPVERVLIELASLFGATPEQPTTD